MPRLNYLGPDPANTDNILNRGQGTAILNAASVNRSATSVAVEAAAALRASKDYVDLQDANYATADYYQSQYALNVPSSSVGQPNGVASLVSGKIPSAQIPVLGQGYLKGPFGPTTITQVNNATTTPIKLAEFTIGNQSVSFQPLAYASVAVDSKPGGRPIIEIRLSNGTASYASQTLVAQGIGQPIFNGRQIVAVTPASDLTGTAPTLWQANTNIVASMWVYSTTATPVTVSSSSVLSAAVYLLRMVA
jgi:hypothetical protein